MEKSRIRFFTAAALLIAISLAAGGCISPKTTQPAPAPPPATPAPATTAPKKTSYWKGEGVSGAPKIVISLGSQRAFFYKGDRLIGESAISSGRKGFETPPGSYRVIQKSKDHVSNLYGDFVDEAGTVVKKNVDTSKQQPPEGATFRGASMPYFLRFHGGYGMHAGRLPGRRASHGCVRLPRWMAAHFYNNAAIGTPVVVE